uniref:Uncharacterized protein n=1 Tax=Fagus sylvatica TaxID=28930 RepID=A0A2N9HNF5_FAGSY
MALFDIDKVNILPQMSRYDYGGQDLFLDQPKDANKDSVSTCWCMLGRIIGFHVSSGRGRLTMNGSSMGCATQPHRRVTEIVTEGGPIWVAWPLPPHEPPLPPFPLPLTRSSSLFFSPTCTLLAGIFVARQSPWMPRSSGSLPPF